MRSIQKNHDGALTPLLAYLLGSIPFGYLIVRWQKGVDVRSTGSGSTGATNVMRNLGIIGFVATFILDVGKGTCCRSAGIPADLRETRDGLPPRRSRQFWATASPSG